jgi:hypothetical protein
MVEFDKAPVFARHALPIRAPREAIWEILTDVQRWPERFPHISAARIEGTIATGGIIRWKSSGLQIVSTIREASFPDFLSWTGKAIGTRAAHEWRLTQRADDVVLETAESFDGWLVRPMRRKMQTMLDKTLQDWLQAIRKAAE